MIATTHDLACAAECFKRVVAVNRTVVADGPSSIALDAAVLARAYGGHLLRLEGDRVLIDDAHHHDEAAERHFHEDGRDGDGLILGPLDYDIFVRSLLAVVIVGTVCAVVGTFVVLKGLAFIGDAISHAAFPGVVAAYLLGGSYVIGAAIAAVSTALATRWITHRGGIRSDTSIGVLFAGMFALGIFMFSTIRGYVGAAELLPEAHRNEGSRWVIAATLAGVAVILFMSMGLEPQL